MNIFTYKVMWCKLLPKIYIDAYRQSIGEQANEQWPAFCTSLGLMWLFGYSYLYVMIPRSNDYLSKNNHNVINQSSTLSIVPCLKWRYPESTQNILPFSRIKFLALWNIYANMIKTFSITDSILSSSSVVLCSTGSLIYVIVWLYNLNPTSHA